MLCLAFALHRPETRPDAPHFHSLSLDTRNSTLGDSRRDTDTRRDVATRLTCRVATRDTARDGMMREREKACDGVRSRATACEGVRRFEIAPARRARRG